MQFQTILSIFLIGALVEVNAGARKKNLLGILEDLIDVEENAVGLDKNHPDKDVDIRKADKFQKSLNKMSSRVINIYVNGLKGKMSDMTTKNTNTVSKSTDATTAPSTPKATTAPSTPKATTAPSTPTEEDSFGSDKLFPGL